MKNGARPTILDRRDQSFHRTFGVASPPELPEEYSVDAGLTMPDQIAEGNPFSCTGYTTGDLGTDQDGEIYSPEYTYMKTLYLQNLPPDTDGSDIRPSLKSAKVFGLLPKKNVPEHLIGKGEDFTADQGNWPVEVDKISGLLEHRKGDYFNVYDDGGLDWYDGFKSALWKNRADNRALSIGTPWFNEWKNPQKGVLTSQFFYDGNPRHYAWHNWAIKGWRVINGVEYLIGKSWQGRQYGDNGWCYIDRETCNKMMKIRGSVCYTLADATEKDIKTIKIGMLYTILDFMARLLKAITFKLIRPVLLT